VKAKEPKPGAFKNVMAAITEHDRKVMACGSLADWIYRHPSVDGFHSWEKKGLLPDGLTVAMLQGKEPFPEPEVEVAAPMEERPSLEYCFGPFVFGSGSGSGSRIPSVDVSGSSAAPEQRPETPPPSRPADAVVQTMSRPQLFALLRSHRVDYHTAPDVASLRKLALAIPHAVDDAYASISQLIDVNPPVTGSAGTGQVAEYVVASDGLAAQVPAPRPGIDGTNGASKSALFQPSTPPSEWGVEEVCNWVIGQYEELGIDILRANVITGLTFLDIDKDEGETGACLKSIVPLRPTSSSLCRLSCGSHCSKRARH